jgi:predicted nucleic acid-binding Zn ribbon protein
VEGYEQVRRAKGQPMLWTILIIVLIVVVVLFLMGRLRGR